MPQLGEGRKAQGNAIGFVRGMNIPDDGRVRFFRTHEVQRGADGKPTSLVEYEESWGVGQGMPVQIYVRVKEKPHMNQMLFTWVFGLLPETAYFPLKSALQLGMRSTQWFHKAYVPWKPCVIELSVIAYKGMPYQELARIMRDRFWQFETPYPWPMYLQAEDGTYYPFSLISVEPELFAAYPHGDELDEDGEPQVKRVFYAPSVPQKMWRFNVMPQRWFDNKKNGYLEEAGKLQQRLSGNWILALLFLFFVFEVFDLLNVGGVVTSLTESWLASFFTAWLGRLGSGLRYVYDAPLRKMYRYGPTVEIFGASIGFWNGEQVEAICATLAKGLDASFWRENRDQAAQCRAMYQEKEDAFVHLFSASVIGFTIYAYLKR